MAFIAVGSLTRDIRYSLRTLRRSPGFTTVAVLSLAIGIGANTAIFSLLDKVVLKMLPVREPERLVLFDWRGTGFTYNQYKHLRDDVPLFEAILGYSPLRLSLRVDGEVEPRCEGQLVTGNYFS